MAPSRPAESEIKALGSRQYPQMGVVRGASVILQDLLKREERIKMKAIRQRAAIDNRWCDYSKKITKRIGSDAESFRADAIQLVDKIHSGRIPAIANYFRAKYSLNLMDAAHLTVFFLGVFNNYKKGYHMFTQEHYSLGKLVAKRILGKDSGSV